MDQQAIILQIHNHHSPACGVPPHIVDRSGQYLGYFENQFGEQMIFVFDRERQTGLLYAGDAGWEQPYTVVKGSVPGLILDHEEQQWLRACWEAVKVAK